ncbi:hypothetical protein QRD38_10210 [Leptospira weilii]|nr:hypothetical protein [Leptospira weilii]MDL5246157.1 hypothetical protein [Leptospira weilii]OMI15969.1 hypothetical protein BUQ74_17965 [Leptospira weilii serovar Heyan]QDK24605.1 hypothetical protein FHG67_19255 [Leptospira weilii]QDK28564.1 hypothetical protein FHG68_19310 [Leptospira weilii]
MGPSLFHRGFVVIPTDLFSNPSICGVGYGKSLPPENLVIVLLNSVFQKNYRSDAVILLQISFIKLTLNNVSSAVENEKKFSKS